MRIELSSSLKTVIQRAVVIIIVRTMESRPRNSDVSTIERQVHVSWIINYKLYNY